MAPSNSKHLNRWRRNRASLLLVHRGLVVFLCHNEKCVDALCILPSPLGCILKNTVATSHPIGSLDIRNIEVERHLQPCSIGATSLRAAFNTSNGCSAISSIGVLQASQLFALANQLAIATGFLLTERIARTSFI